MNKLVPKEFLLDGTDKYIDGNLVKEWVESKENKNYLSNFMTEFNKHQLNQYGNGILAKIDLSLEKAIKEHISIVYPYLRKRKFKSNSDYMAFVNSIILMHVKKEIDNLPTSQIIDPLWTMKGPDFRATTKEWNRPGHTYAMELGPTGRPHLNPRFANSKMYWNKKNFTQSLGNSVNDSIDKFDRF